MPVRQRLLKIEKREAGDGKKTYHASMSSETPVERYGFTEILEHSADAVNMSRAANGLPLLFNHNPNSLLGRWQNIGLREDGKLAGDFFFSETEEAQLRRGQIDEGVLTDVSVRYSIDEEQRTETSDGKVTYTATRWTPLEGSLVSVAADNQVGIGRSADTSFGDITETSFESQMRNLIAEQIDKSNSREVTTMPSNVNNGGDQQPTGTGAADPNENVIDFDGARTAGRTEGIHAERQRQTDINALYGLPRYSGNQTIEALRQACIDQGLTLRQSERKLLEHLGHEGDETTVRACDPQTHEAQRQQSPVVRVVEDAADDVHEGMRLSLMERANFIDDDKTKRNAGQSYFRGWSMVEMCRHSLELMGVRTAGMDSMALVGYALCPRALPSNNAVRNAAFGAGTSVFTAVVENIANKGLMRGFNESDETWRAIAFVGSVSSFRQESRVDMSSFSDLDEVPELGEFTRGEMSDAKEYVTAKTYGKLFALSRQVIVNDDITALAKATMFIGRAADRKVGDLVYAILTGNPTLTQDSTALFHANHSNIVSSGGSPSVDQFDSMKVLMSLQKDNSSNAHGQNIQMERLIVPKALETDSVILANATHDPFSNAATSGNANTGGTRLNPFAGTFQVVADPRLDAASSVIYYGAADPNKHDVIEAAFLNGNENPMLESQNGWTVDGIEYKIRHDVGVSALGYKGLVRNPGA